MGDDAILKANEWRKRIMADCEAAGTYRPAFDTAISALAGVLARRDEIEKRYVDEGSEAVLIHTNKTGDEIARPNPLLTIWNSLTTTALSYWKELGLTPSGLRKIDESAMKPKKKSVLTEALKELEK